MRRWGPCIPMASTAHGTLKRVLAPLLNGADVVIGSRFLDNNIPSCRKVGMKVLDTATAVAGVKSVIDSQSGLTSIRETRN